MKIISKVVAAMMAVAVALTPVVSMAVSAPAYAAEGEDGGVSTSILPGNWGIMDVLRLVLNIVLYGLGAAAVLGVIIAGIMYMTARDNEQQMQKAKTRLFEVVIGLVAWAALFAFLNWAIPGGVPDAGGESGDDGGVYIQAPSSIENLF